METKKMERWFSGNALHTLKVYVIPTLVEAEAQGYWPKGASRKVYAALNKQAPAAKFSRGGVLEQISDNRQESWKRTVKGWELNHAMMFGAVTHADRLEQLCQDLVPYCTNDAERAALATATEWVQAFAPVARLLKLLDASQPKPVYLFKTLSPTVVKTLQGCGLDLLPETVRVPPIEWKWVEARLEVKRHQVGTILWPAGTQHNRSRFGGSQCQACGHGIRNGFNWVPLVMDDAAGVPHSLWVGRDCAQSIFGCEMTGEAEYENR